MADIVKTNGGVQPQAPSEWNPMRLMRQLFGWDPFRDIASAFPAMPALEGVAWSPSFDVLENKDSYVFKADVPGVKKEDLEITVTGNRIQLVGKRDATHEAKTDTIYTYERQYGSFCRTFTLPEGADLEHAKSELADGVLTLVIPKVTASRAKRIPITATSSKS